jgi:hypothetical protein
LFGDAGNDRLTPLFQFAQVAQAFLEHAQLRVIEPARGFLAVARDERHRGAAIQQFHGSGNLCRFGGDFFGNLLCDRGHQGFRSFG